nr:cupin domain-containing protein [uncultured Methanospirillum sp.]
MGEELQDMKGKILKPTELVRYQDGSVVSRMITYTPQGTITMFAFAAGSGLSEHTAPFDAVLQVLEGAAEVTLAGENFQVGSGDMIILPATIPHAVHASIPFKMMLTMIHA